jgi:RNA-directed DNA polymerase
VRRRSVDCIDRADVPLHSKLLFWGLRRKSIVPYCLSIGAPSSPALSNIMLFDLDTVFFERAAKLGIVYTRYADDITASAESIEQLEHFEHAARRTVRLMKHPSARAHSEDSAWRGSAPGSWSR